MPIVTRTLSSLNQAGMLGIVLLQGNLACADPVDVTVFATDGDGNEFLVSTVSCPGAQPTGTPGNRLAALADVPASTGFRVVASNGVSLEPLDMQLIYGVQGLTKLQSPVVAVPLTQVSRSPAIAPNFAREISPPDQNGSALVSVNQNPASIFGVTVRLFGRDNAGNFYLIGQTDLAAPGGVARRAALIGDVPGGLFYRATVIGDVGATLAFKYGPADNLEATDAPSISGSGVRPAGETAPESVTYVATNGNDSSGQRGNPLAPFATVQAAIDASQAEDTILIAPGSYGAPVVAPDFDLSIIGQGNRNDVQLNSITWNPTTGSLLYLASLEFGGGTFAGDGVTNQAILRLNDCSTFAPITVEFLDQLLTDRCQIDATIDNCNGGTLRGTIVNGTLNLDEPIPAAVTPATMRFLDCRIIGVAGLAITGNPICEIVGGTATAVTFGNPTVSAVGQSAELRMSCRCEGLGVATAFSNTVDIRGSVIDQLLSEHDGPDPRTVDARNATINTAALTTLGAGDNVLDTRGGSLGDFTGSSFDAGSRWRRDGGAAIVTLPPGSKAYEWSSAGGAILGALYPSHDQVAFILQPVTDPVLITLQSSAGFTADNTGAAPQDCALIYSYVGLS